MLSLRMKNRPDSFVSAFQTRLRVITLGLAFFFPSLLFAQQKPATPHLAADAPGWMYLLAAENPNVLEVQKAYAAFYENRPFEKNSYTQYFKHWMHWARPFVQPDGSLKEPGVAELAERERSLLSQRTAMRGNAGTWSFLGPKQTFDTDGLTTVTWQTNIYAIDIALSNPNILYAGGETGGLWKTTDKGQNWQLLTLNVLHGAFGAVIIHPTDPNTVYAGTS